MEYYVLLLLVLLIAIVIIDEDKLLGSHQTICQQCFYIYPPTTICLIRGAVGIVAGISRETSLVHIRSPTKVGV